MRDCALVPTLMTFIGSMPGMLGDEEWCIRNGNKEVPSKTVGLRGLEAGRY